MSSEAIEEFVGITQASDEVAKQFLTAFEGNVQAAIEAFFEEPSKYQNASGGAPSSAIDEEFDEDGVPMPEDYVRAPMQQVRKRLVAEDMPVGRGRGRRNDNPTEAFRDLRKEQNALFSGRSLNKKASGLADLFRPPLDLLYKGSYEKAMAHAIKKSCWLLINVQDPGIFDCQLLNRDTWSDESVKEVIKSSFIMVQLYNGSETASEYTDWHIVSKTPHIAILDPETGERLWLQEGILSAADMCTQLRNFLKEHPYDLEGGPTGNFDDIPTSKKRLEDMTEDEQMAFVIAQSLGEESDLPVASAPKKTRNGRPKRVKLKNDDSDEDFVDAVSDEELEERTREKRPRASRNTKESSKPALDDSGDEEPPTKRAKQSEPIPSPVAPPVAAAPEPIDDLPPEEEEEIPEGPPDCTLQIRLPDGSNVVQKFHSTQKLASVLRFVRKHLNKKSGFVLGSTFPRRKFTTEDLTSLTLKDASLTPRAVVVVEEA